MQPWSAVLLNRLRFAVSTARPPELAGGSRAASQLHSPAAGDDARLKKIVVWKLDG